MTGRPVAASLADPLDWLKAVHPDDLPAVQAGVREGRTELAYRILHPSGAIKHAVARTFPVQGARRRPRRPAHRSQRRPRPRQHLHVPSRPRRPLTMDPAQLLPYFQLVGQVSLVVAAFVAVYQLLALRGRRHQEAALQVITSLQTQAFRDAFSRVNELPLAATPEQVRADPRVEEAAGTIMMTFETLGVLVHSRVVPIELVDQVIGGFLRESWRRLQPYTEWKRKAIGSARWGEWYQWLFEHLAVNPRRQAGAYEVFRDWKA